MLFKPGTPLYAHEIEREGGEDVLYINYLGAPFVPSLEDSFQVTAQVLDILTENQNISRVVLVQQRNYNYNFDQVSSLLEIAQLYNYLVKEERVSSQEKLQVFGNIPARHSFLTYFLTTLRGDPILAYVELRRAFSAETPGPYASLLEKMKGMIENTKVIKSYLKIEEAGGEYKGREVYHQIFSADIIPNFTFTRLVATLPKDADIVAQYEIASGYDASMVTILKKENDSKYLYHIIPPEYALEEDQHLLLNIARNVLIEHRPKQEEYTDPERTRQIFFNIARDLLQELARTRGIRISYPQLNRLAGILVRHTVGFGIIEILLQDENLQDIVMNAPISQNPVFVRHAEFDECVTNITPSQEDADSWAGKFRLISGRPLDDANPILDTELSLGKARARVAIIQQPLSPYGLAYALRRHRDEPWTLPLFIEKKMIDPFAAGLISFLVDGARTVLIAGTRSSGKTSLLGSLMLEIMTKYRIIVLEDVLELPVDAMKKLGYDILRMKVRSALLQSGTEVPAEEGIRTSLRLGDSSLILGEIRSTEAKALYEAMRVGALANVVAGTVHGASPYAVFDRVVNDLGVPVTSFKATDVVIVANPIRSPDGLHSYKRITGLTEVRKNWTRDPLEEKGFVDLLRYNIEKDALEPTADLINGDSEVIKSIASSVRGWAGNWDAVYDNILLRGKMKHEIVEISRRLKNPVLLEADFNAMSNNAFYVIADKIRREVGLPVSERVFPEWKKWLEKAVKSL